MINRIAWLMLASALPLMLSGIGAQAKEEHDSSSATKSSSANSSATQSGPNSSHHSTDQSSHSSRHKSSSRFSQDDAREALRKGKVMPLTAILEIVAKRQPGTVIGVDLEPRRTGLIYEIDVITEDGRRRELRLDARNGEILAVEDE
jgi:uncharacterized membrane protein YkoI